MNTLRNSIDKLEIRYAVLPSQQTEHWHTEHLLRRLRHAAIGLKTDCEREDLGDLVEKLHRGLDTLSLDTTGYGAAVKLADTRVSARVFELEKLIDRMIAAEEKRIKAEIKSLEVSRIPHCEICHGRGYTWKPEEWTAKPCIECLKPKTAL